ncbi:S8 family serine peptidase [Nocardioides sp. CFH 31398]|uniref:S8 family serine peptidase n=1 Tax=Nocardioides sp. CFH 31398 TaxID=2919579 RepID=UPI001F069D88|nr:S8 family serine peptidase [Nocardioides sp. CFH 31398]MCH1868546.1 hypothetical protein [Nocardioides sp. CFH 31398]
MTTLRRAAALTTATVVAAGLTQLVPTSASVGTVALPLAPASSADAVDDTLGNGLGRLLAQEELGARSAPGLGGGLEVDQESLAIRDDEGRVLVQVAPADGASAGALRRAADDLGFVETAVDEETGVLEGFAPLSAVTDLAALPQLGTIAQVPKPVTHAGDVTYQGVGFQGVDRVLRRGVDGEGVTVGILSDSYDQARVGFDGEPITSARDDVRSGDLPGRGNPDGNTQPVVVIEDYEDPTATDEGRGMAQIVHDTAPAAKLCFATAFTGEIGFADNIRALSDPEGPCDADVIVDDISYFSAPFFSDDVIGRAVEEVTADGVAYFSSAGNAGDQNAWRSRVSLVPRSRVPAAARAAGLDLSDVDPALYAGGLQDMNTRGGVDVAQTLELDPGGGLLNLKWSDPVDPDGPELGEPLLEDSGRLTDANTDEGLDFGFRVTEADAGESLLVTVDGVPTGTTDVVVSVRGPNGFEVGPVDTITSPEVVPIDDARPGRYTVTVTGFQGATGRFTVQAAPVVAPSDTSTDFAALVFSPDGDYLGAIDEDNTITGRPGELASLSLSDDEFTSLQLVLARKTTGRTPVQEIGYINNGGLLTAEYFSPTAPATYGHPATKAAIGVAAMDPFAPYLAETFTSPGGAMRYYFDEDNQRLEQPEVRRKPDVTSTDGGNTTFFYRPEDPRDPDDFPNFFGTSAAAPQAAAIAALMIDRAGGPGSLSPAQVDRTMKQTAYRHDLDPFRASGTAGGVTLSAKGSEAFGGRSASPASLDDPNFFRVSYDGDVPLRSVTLVGRTASPTALGRTAKAPSAGLVFDPRAAGGPGAWVEGGFPFTVGATTGGVQKRSVIGRTIDRVGSTPFYERLRVTFGVPLRGGQGVNFGIDRDLRFPGGDLAPQGGDSADELGGAVRLPGGGGGQKGLKFVATFANGDKVAGRMRNTLGTGFSPVTGFGPVDAFGAVFGGDR